MVVLLLNMEFLRDKSATIRFRACNINQDILQKFLGQYNVWEDEWKQYILGRIIANRPRCIGKINTWWYNFISLKDIDLLMKTMAKRSYVADGGVITEYGVFDE